MGKTFIPMMSAAQKAARDKRNTEKSKHLNECVDCEPYYWPQTVQFTAEQLPEVKKWEVGKEYQITLKVKMTAYEQRKSEGGEVGNKEKEEGRFEITAIRADDTGLSAKQKKIMDHMTYRQ